MRIGRIISMALLLAICILLTPARTVEVLALTAVTGTDRISGTDRYQTAVAISHEGWTSSEYAVLARGDDFADALCAGPLAYQYGGPILLTAPDQLNSEILKELQRLGVKHVFIAGGLNAVSASVESMLRAGGIATIERIYGSDRYATSVKIAEKIGNSTKAVLATGSDFPDALSISGIAAKWRMPILLTAKDRLPAVLSDYFDKAAVTRTYVVGDTDVISDEAADSAPGTYRIAGRDRYETNAAIIRDFAGALNFDIIYTATGVKFADALTGAVLAAKTSSPLVLVNQQLSAATANDLEMVLGTEGAGIALGGEDVVPIAVLNKIAALRQSETMNIAVYYLKDQYNELSLIREVHAVQKSTGVARAALNTLISGQPLTYGAYSVLPTDSKILGITIENGLATVDFSKEVLHANVGAAGEALGIASIVNSLTEFPTIQKVQFTVDGSAENGMDWWGHIGLYGQPFERDLSFVNEPVIWVTLPAVNQIISSPVRIKGNARIFEATVCYRLRDADGTVLASGCTMAAAGAPDRGDFEGVLNFTPSVAGKGQIEVFEASMKDGNDLHMVVIPVKW